MIYLELKKKQKTPKKELDTALDRMKEYLSHNVLFTNYNVETAKISV